MSKPPPSVSHKGKPGSAGGKKDGKKQADEEQPATAPPPPPLPVAPFDLLPSVWSLPSLSGQRDRISVLFGLADCPAGCLCFARVALDLAFQHLRFASTLALSPLQARFVHQLLCTVLSELQLPDERWSIAALRNKVKLLLTTNCVELLPATTYIDTTHLLAPLDLPAPASTAPSSGASPDIPSSSAASGGPASPSSSASRPSTASASAGKRPPPSTRNKPAAPPSPQQQQPVKASKPLTGKEKEAAAAADKAATLAAAEAALAEAAALAALPPAPPTPPPHFLTAEQMARVWRYADDRLLRHADMHRAVHSRRVRRGREADRAQYEWRRVKQQPDEGWLRPLHQASSEQPVVESERVNCELTLQPGEYSAEERACLLQVKAGMEQQLREAVQQQQQQQRGKEVEEKEQQEAGVAGPSAILVR